MHDINNCCKGKNFEAFIIPELSKSIKRITKKE